MLISRRSRSLSLSHFTQIRTSSSALGSRLQTQRPRLIAPILLAYRDKQDHYPHAQPRASFGSSRTRANHTGLKLAGGRKGFQGSRENEEEAKRKEERTHSLYTPTGTHQAHHHSSTLTRPPHHLTPETKHGCAQKSTQHLAPHVGFTDQGSCYSRGDFIFPE
jgi:hypothetical protein